MNSVLTFQREPLMPAFQEAGPLFREHYEEIAWKQDKVKLDPDVGKYAAYEKADVLRVFIARRDGILVGYAAYILSRPLHYKGIIAATNDVVFLSKSERGGAGVRLMKFAEKELIAEGVQAISLHIKTWANWGKLAERMGYEHTEVIYQKWVG